MRDSSKKNTSLMNKPLCLISLASQRALWLLVIFASVSCGSKTTKNSAAAKEEDQSKYLLACLWEEGVGAILCRVENTETRKALTDEKKLNEMQLDWFVKDKKGSSLEAELLNIEYLEGQKVQFLDGSKSPWLFKLVMEDYSLVKSIEVEQTGHNAKASSFTSKKVLFKDIKDGDLALMDLQVLGEGYSNQADRPIEWTSIDKAVHYELKLSKSDECKGEYASLAEHPDESFSMEAGFVEQGVYFVCLQAVLKDGRIKRVKDYPYQFTFDSIPPEIPELTLNDGPLYTPLLENTLKFAEHDAKDYIFSKHDDCEIEVEGVWQEVVAELPIILEQANAENQYYLMLRDAAQNMSECTLVSIFHDDVPPKDGSLLINSDAESTLDLDVELSINIDDADQMYISNSATCDIEGSWEEVTETKAWTLLHTDSENVVSVKFQDKAGNLSECYTDTIIHTTIKPEEPSIALATVLDYTREAEIDLVLGVKNANLMYITEDAGCVTGGVWEAYSTSKTWNLNRRNQVVNLYAIYADDRGQTSECVSTSIIHDDIPPTDISLAIAEGASAINQFSTTVSIQAVDAVQMIISRSADCQTGAAWEAFASEKTWELDNASPNAQHFIFGRFVDQAGNTSECISESIFHDDIPPQSAVIDINSAATYATSEQVSVGFSVAGASSVYLTNTAGCNSDGEWQTIEGSSASWGLGQLNATATVYAKFRDEAGNVGTCVSDQIIHDDIPPSSASISIDEGEYTQSTTINLSLAAVDAQDLYVTQSPGCHSGGAWESYTTAKAVDITAQANSVASVYVKYRDVAGNETACLSDSIVHDTIAPTPIAISIKDGDDYTRVLGNSLSLTGGGASDVYITNIAGCGSGGTWQSFAASIASWNLDAGQQNATATVYAKFRDAAGNVSACINDTIIHDNIAPSGESLSIDAGASYTTDVLVNLSLGVTGGVEQYVTNEAACASGGSWQSFSASYSDWSIGSQLNTTARVYVKFRDQAGNESSCINDDIIHDDIPPTNPTLLIDSGAEYTQVLGVTLSLSAGDAVHRYVTNTLACSSGGTWENYGTSAAWNITGQENTTAVVYVKYRDLAGNESSCVSDSIIHDDIPPTDTSISINDDAGYVNTSTGSLSLGATGASDMYISNVSGCGSGGSWEAFAVDDTWTLGQNNATATVYVKYRDAAGNVSSCINDTIIHDDIPPLSPSINIASSALYTSSVATSLSLGSSDASEMFISNVAGCGSGGSYESFATSKAWTLGQENETATVYVKFKDLAENETACISDTILHDNIPPVASASIDDGVSSPQTHSDELAWSAGSDSGSGVASYELAIGSSPGGSDVLDWSDVGNVLTTTVSGLSMAWDVTRYVSLRVVDEAGNISSVTEGDGFLVGWRQEAYVKAANSDPGDYFGHSVSIDQDTMVVGTYSEDSQDVGIDNGSSASADNSLDDTGAVYVYKRSSRAWAPEAFIKADYVDYEDRFGHSVSVDGDTLVVGAPLEDSSQSSITTVAASDNNLIDSGAVYVYTRSGVTWSLQAYIKAPNAGIADQFGYSVALDGDTLAVGAPNEDSNVTSVNSNTSSQNNNSSDTGAVYIFKRTGNSWALEAYVKANNNDVNDYFGRVIDLNLDTLVVGVEAEDSNLTTISNGSTASSNNSSANSGAVYVYKRSASTWAQESYIKAVNNDAYDKFGASVAVYGDTIVVGAPEEDSNETSIANGASASSDNDSSKSGAVYVYSRSGANWSQQSYIKPSNSEEFDRFGTSVAVSNDDLLVGSSHESSSSSSITNSASASDDNSSAEAGAVYVFSRSGVSWVQKSYFKAPNSGGEDHYGIAIDINDNTAVVGATREDSQVTAISNGTTASSDDSVANSGAVYIINR